MHVPTFLIDVSAHLSKQGAIDLQDAYEIAKDMYGDRKYPTGETILAHATAVVTLLVPLHPDTQTFIAALLQYATTSEELKRIEDRFGKDVRSVIASLGVIEKGCWEEGGRSAAELHKILLALSQDIRLLIICLHDCAHTLKRHKDLPEKFRVRLARETLDVFAPLCAKLGIYSLKYTLEAEAFLILHPQEEAEIRYTFDAIFKKQGDVLSVGRQSVRSLLQDQDLSVTITARKKHPYSIFRKMHRKGISSMADLYDLFGMRIIVHSPEDCYRILGMLHGMYRPILHRIKDYIGMPKPNGYRSLHTTVLGLCPQSPTMPIEIQIRTSQMDTEALYGVAAHWDYKERGGTSPLESEAWQKRMMSLENLTKGKEPEEVSEMQEDLSDRIYVLTPKGDPIELPKGATPLDFAFRIHTDVGLCYRMGKVNGVIATKDQHLENGDVVEILTWKDPCPSEQWIQEVRTKDARQKLRNYFQKNPEKKAGVGQR